MMSNRTSPETIPRSPDDTNIIGWPIRPKVSDPMVCDHMPSETIIQAQAPEPSPSWRPNRHERRTHAAIMRRRMGAGAR